MKQRKKKKLIITSVVIPFIIGLAVNFVYDTVKNHPYSSKSGFNVEFNLKINFN